MSTYEYPRPAFTADVVVFRDVNGVRKVLLIQRRFEPFAGMWALPGGFLDEWELPEDAARRELAEETGIVWDGPLVLVGIFGKRDRDPRGWTVSAVYVAELGERRVDVQAGDDAGEVRWFPADALPVLAFDHEEVMAMALSMASG
ncbi:MAG: NUDIX hydrolase [Coriobacteriia bacterium]|nr:NUDIX hydrolase [Coriobacteriia bacterium]